MRTEPVLPGACEPLDARCFIASHKQAVADPRDSGKILVERIVQKTDRAPIREREIDLANSSKGHGV